MAGCFGDTTVDHEIEVASTDDEEDVGADDTTGGEADETDGIEDTEADEGSTGAGVDDDDTGTSDDTTGEEEPPPPLEGPGCNVEPVCDRGTYEGNLVLSDEASSASIEGYSHTTGWLFIRESEFTCLDFLACLESARGIVIERNDALVNLDGLGALEEVLFQLNINRNAVLEDVSGLVSLERIASGGDDVQLGHRGLVVFENPSLAAITGLEALTELEGDVSITHNAGLVELSGLTALGAIAKHPNANKGPGQPAFVAGSLVVSQNKSLERITGFSGLATIDQNLVIQYNDVLSELTGLHALQAIGGALVITNNPELCVSETYLVGGELESGPGDLANSSTVNNKSGC